MLVVDSQIWIYYLDPNAPENRHVEPWLDDVLDHETILLAAIIPMEIAHCLFAIKDEKTKILKEKASDFIENLVLAENCVFVDVDQPLVIEALHLLEELRGLGIGGRDTLIIASMQRHGIDCIATHDKNMLKLTRFRRIDPAVSPPLNLAIGDEYVPA
ncbi:MAG: type II toxin-antitoxin system VapC family toxin [Candidatus Sigynarchaeum springense]